jgi:hypothetical protein
VNQLIQQLGDGLFQAREAAVHALAALGPAVLPALEGAQEHADPEVRRRLARLIPDLERAAVLEPTRVSLHLHRRPLQEAITELSKQTGYRMVLQGHDPKQLFDFSCERVTFWEALDKVCEAGKIALQGVDPNEALLLVHQDGFVPFVHRAGPFRFVAQSFQYTRTLDFSAVPSALPELGQHTESLDFTFSVFAEPKAPLVSMGPVQLKAAYDDRHLCMLADADPETGNEARNAWMAGFVKSYLQATQINLVRPSRESRQAKIIRGVVPVALLIAQRPTVLSDRILAAKGKKVTTGTACWHIEDVARDPQAGNHGYRIKVTIAEESRAKDAALDANWVNSLQQRIELQDPKGNRYAVQMVQWENVTPASVRGTVVFGDSGNAGLGPPAKLLYCEWVTMTHQVPFEFRNLPLP